MVSPGRLGGICSAQNNVGYMYETGRVPTTSAASNNGSEAVKWYRKAARIGIGRRGT